MPAMRLGVVSDSHGHVELTRPAIRLLESMEVDQVLHCGDIGTPAVVELFAAWPTHFVFGNCDADRQGLAAAIKAAGQTCHDEFGDLKFSGKRVALLHSHDGRRFHAALHSGDWDLVCYGHTHVASIDRHGQTLSLNPGALYRAATHSIAIVDLPDLTATILPL
jgi:putative phosphoesterase